MKGAGSVRRLSLQRSLDLGRMDLLMGQQGLP